MHNLSLISHQLVVANERAALQKTILEEARRKAETEVDHLSREDWLADHPDLPPFEQNVLNLLCQHRTEVQRYNKRFEQQADDKKSKCQFLTAKMCKQVQWLRYLADELESDDIKALRSLLIDARLLKKYQVVIKDRIESLKARTPHFVPLAIDQVPGMQKL